LPGGVEVELRVVAQNENGWGVPSHIVKFTPAALPEAPTSISVVEYFATALKLQWTVPLDTGAGDQTLKIETYELQVDEGFGNGFVPLTQDGYTELTFKHEALITGHTYVYRVRSKNIMGFGAVSSQFSFVPRSVPKKPNNAPANVKEMTNKN
jgi:hypothetical protein